MEIGINIRHQNGASWPEICEGVLEAERLGFDFAAFPDHYLTTEHIVGPDGQPGLLDRRSRTGPSDCWTLIAALAPLTSRIRLGTMMTSSTFRYPGPLAVSVAQCNAISGGRVDLGLGTNWDEGEHESFGLPYPPLEERFDRLEEQLRIILGFWDTPAGESFSLGGTFFSVRDAPGIPRPADLPRARVIIGGHGLVRTPRVAARFADEVNSLAQTPDGVAAFFTACADACEQVGRDPDSQRRSVLMSVVCGEDDADIERHLAAAGLRRDQLGRALVCQPPELVERLREWAAAGVDRVVLSRRGSVDLPSIQVLGEQVIPALRTGGGPE